MTNEHVILNVHLRAAAGREEEAASHLKGLIAPTRNEPGCITYVLHRDPENPANLMFYEEFESQAALDAHTSSPHFLAWVAYQEEHKGLIESAVVTRWQSIA